MDEFTNYIIDEINKWREITHKRMFGGCGIFCNGLMFALTSNDGLYIKAGENNKESLIALGLSEFIYYKGDKPFKMNYFLITEDIIEDEAQFHDLLDGAFHAALIANQKKH